MPPVMHQSMVLSDSIIMRWEKNINGNAPAYYEIHASNEAYGFTPSTATLLDTAQRTFKILNTTDDDLPPKTFYRIIAVDNNGARSGPSNYISILYPHVYNKPDTIITGKEYTLALETNDAQITDGVEFFMPYSYSNFYVDEPIEIDVLSKPDWLAFDQATNALRGKPDYIQAHSADSIVISFKGLKTGYSNIQSFNLPVLANSVPTLSDVDSVVYVNSFFENFVTVSDPDLNFGDFIRKIEVLEKPSWLEADYFETSGTMHLRGTPQHEHEGNTVLILRVYDALSSFTKIYPIHVKTFEEGTALFPNPFRDSAGITCLLPRAGSVNVVILNSTGQKVGEVTRKYSSAGLKQITWDGENSPSGVYYFKIKIFNHEGIITSGVRGIKLE